MKVASRVGIVVYSLMNGLFMLLHNHTYKHIENNANRQLSNSGILADVFQMLLPLIFYVQSIPIVKHGRFVDVMDEHLIASNILL